MIKNIFKINFKNTNFNARNLSTFKIYRNNKDKLK